MLLVVAHHNSPWVGGWEGGEEKQKSRSSGPPPALEIDVMATSKLLRTVHTSFPDGILATFERIRKIHLLAITLHESFV